MALTYYKSGSISRPTGAVTDYPCRLGVGEGSPVYGAPKSGRYIKFTIASNWGNSLCAMTSLWACGKDGNKLNNEGMTHTKSTIVNGSAEACSNTNTGDYWQWSISNAPATWTVDLGSSQSIYYIKTQYAEYQNRNMKDFTVHLSDNGSDWTLVLDTQTADSTSLQTFQVADLFDVGCNGHCQSDFGDIRFFDGSDNALDYWVDWGTLTGTTPNQSVEVWVKTAAASGGTTVKMKYGDAALTDASCDVTDIFIKADDYEWGANNNSLSTGEKITYTTVSNGPVISTEKAYSGTRSAKFPYNANRATIMFALTAADTQAISFRIYKETAVRDCYLMHGNGSKVIFIRIANIVSSNSIAQYSTAWNETGYFVTPDSWDNKIEVRNVDWNAGTYDIYLNDSPIKIGASMYSAADRENLVSFVGSSYAMGQDVWIDDVIVRKYASPEPVWGAWGEETEIEPEAVTETTSLDGLLQKSSTVTASLNGLLQDSLSAATSLDAYLPDTAASTVSLDGILQESLSATTSLDSLLEDIVSVTTSLDSLLENIVTATVSLDGALQSSGSTSTSLDGQLVGSASATASIDSILQKALSASTSLDSLLEDTVSATASLDSLLQDINSSTTGLDSQLQSSSSASASIDGMLFSSSQATIGLDAVLSDSATVVILSLDSLLQDTNTATASLDAQVTSTLDETTSFDGVLQAVITAAASIDAVLQGNPSLTVNLDSLLEDTVSATTSLDSILVSVGSANTSLDAALQDTNSAIVNLDVTLLQTITVATSLDSVLVIATPSVTTELDAVLKGTETFTTSLDSLLEDTRTSTTSIDALLTGFTVRTTGLDAIIYASQTWIQEGNTFISSAANAVAFGASVSISADAKVLAVGDCDARLSTYYIGHVEIFDKIEGVWTLRGSPLLPAGITTQNCRFGSAVSLSEYGDTLAVGAYGYYGTYSSQGCVYIYDYDGDSWVQRGNIIISPNAGAGLCFGFSVYLAPNKQILYVGEPRYNSPGAYTGIVYIYTWNVSTETWDYDSYIQPSTPLSNDTFGSSIAKSGNKVAIGAVGYYAAARAGAVYIFEENTGVHTQHSILTPLDAYADNEFGTCVSLAQDGDLLVVGATSYTYEDASNTGCIYTFKWTGSSYTEHCPKEIPAAAGAWEMIGCSVSMTEDGNTLVSGAVGNSPGSIYFYDNIEEIAGSYPNFYIDKSSTDLDIASESSGGIVYQQSIAESFYLWTMSYPAWGLSVASTTDLVSTLTFDLGISVYSYVTCLETLSSKWTGSISVLEALALTSTAEDARYLLEAITSTYNLSDEQVATFETALTEWLDIRSTLSNSSKMFFELLSTTDLSCSTVDIWLEEITSALDISSLSQYDIVEALESATDLSDTTLLYLAAALSDSIDLSSESRVALALSVLSEIGFTSLASFISAPQESILSELEMADTLEANGIFNHSLASSVFLTEEAQAALSLLVTSVLALTSTAALKQWLTEQVTSAAILASNTSALQSMYPSLESSLIITETLLGNGAYYETVQSALQLTVSIELYGDVYECWVLNSPKFLPSIYTDYDFNSYCTYENRAFAANATGVYELAGDADNVQASVVLSETDFEISGHKRFRKAYLGISGTSPVLIMETDGQRKVYSIASDGKVNASRELLGKYWKLSVVDFDTIEYISLIPVVLSRGK